MDGLELTYLRDQAQKGELPHFAQLFSEGISAELESIEPMLSPAIWTTVASGYLPELHGVKDWISSDGRLTSAADVRSHRLWDMVGQQGKTSLVSGWLMTTPATALHGMMLSDRLVWHMSMDSYVRTEGGSEQRKPQINSHMEGLSFPKELTEIAKNWMPTQANLAESGLGYQLKAYGVGRHPLPKDETHLRAFEALWSGQDLGLLYLFSADQVSHLYWPFVEQEALNRLKKDPLARKQAYTELHQQLGHENDQRAFPWVKEPITAAQIEEGKRWVPDTYKWLDQALGRVMAKIDPSTTTLVVLSDHGFQKANHLVVLDANHKNPGSFLAWGRGVQQLEAPIQAHVSQIAPTVLRLLGVPLAEDMQPPLQGAFNYPPEVSPQKTYAQLPTLAPRPSQDPEKLKETLRALGYLE